MYGDDDDYATNNSRPLSFMPAPSGGEQIPERRVPDPPSPDEHRLHPMRSTSDKSDTQGAANSNGQNGSSAGRSQAAPMRMPSQRSLRNNSSEGASSPISPISPMSPTLRDMREGSEYPLTNIDNASDIAQELSNLQALRRMSMDVSNNSDPDLLPYQGMSLMAMPSIAPRGDDDADPSRLLWVPAGVHPELAPSEFKSFVEKRVQSMKRRSGESSLSVDGLDSGAGSLRRKKSMLSRQIDNASIQGTDGYKDGAERLERKRSEREPGQGPPELSLDELMKDPTKAVQKLTLESQNGEAMSNKDDMPILPVAPGMGLRRSTRTTYRKGGSLRNRQGSVNLEERLPFSKRIAAKKTEEGSDVLPTNESTIEAPPGHGLTRVQSEPVAENFSRPTRSVRRQRTFSRDDTASPYESGSQEATPESSPEVSSRPPGPRRMPSADSVRSSGPIPQIIETPTIEEESEPQDTENHRPFPERSSSQQSGAQAMSQTPSTPVEPPTRSNKRPTYSQELQNTTPPAPSQTSSSKRSPSGSNHNTNDMNQGSSPLPGGNANRTDALAYIPTYSPPEEKKSEKKSRKEKRGSEGSSRGASWKWFQKSEDKEKKKDDEHQKSKTKAFVEKAQDNVRLDVLQTSIDTAFQKGRDKGRESLLLDRDNVDSKLEEERRKESSRKSGEHKKEKDGIFASFFSSKRKGDRDSGSRKSQSLRPHSPEPAPYRALQPDVDYHWTRFPILEERAIYRMAHIKLANPRRALYSQVLLSNFMYDYLAKVQAMHPQIQVPQSPQQKRLQEEERRRRELEQQQQQYMEQQQAQESMDQYNFEYHRSANQYGDPSMQHEAGDYPEAAEIYDYGHNKDQQQHHTGHDGMYHQDADDYGGQDGGKDYYSYGHGNGNGHPHSNQQEEEEMW
ncbi:hypothetical protein F5X96DRAFT_676769 [Biscogniauxia mediterranea]|nr:hypothetical protein F5X96DRAFT_676769 [Biscogniauxia mediterranea]